MHLFGFSNNVLCKSRTFLKNFLWAKPKSFGIFKISETIFEILMKT
jgi:hypothetical protein